MKLIKHLDCFKTAWLEIFTWSCMGVFACVCNMCYKIASVRVWQPRSICSPSCSQGTELSHYSYLYAMLHVGDYLLQVSQQHTLCWCAIRLCMHQCLTMLLLLLASLDRL